jgi:hypothetical protein
MSLPSSFPQGAPSLAEVLLQRTFAKPPKPFVDGEFLEALERSDDKPAPTGAPASGSSHSDPGSASDDAATRSSAAPAPGKTVDVRV